MCIGLYNEDCFNILRRKFIGIELEEKYYDIAEKRITENLHQKRL